MSKIGNAPITVPIAVTVQIPGDFVEVKGPNGTLTHSIPHGITVSREGERILVKTKKEDKKTKSMHGFYRQLLANAIAGVEKAWEKRLEVVGTGFNVKLQGEDLIFKLGFSHTVTFVKVPNIIFKVEGNTKVIVSGIDKQKVGQIAYQIKILKKPDVYKGKGIRYQGEIIKLKPGKKVKATTGAA